MNITICPKCSECYEEVSEEEANNPDRMCSKCFKLIKIIGNSKFETMRNNAAGNNRTIHEETIVLLYDYILYGKKYFKE